MPAESHLDTTSSSPYHALVGVVAAVFSFAALCLVFSHIGVRPLESIIIAGLSSLVVGAFVYRERTLEWNLAVSERQHFVQLSQMNERMDRLYADSVACLVEFDAGTLIVDRASPGFFDVLGISSDRSLRGARLEEVLGVESTRLESIIYQIKAGTISVREELVCKQADGKPIKLLISGSYLPHLHSIEAALFRVTKKLNESTEFEKVMEDLERFRKGMVRRESRILELKGEVNRLLTGTGEPALYRVDDATDDSRFARMMEGKGDSENG